MFWRGILVVISLLGSSALIAETLVLESGKSRNTLVELYTSEGCSSCPPAEAYLNQQIHNPRLWQDIVPVAFHVDYWDYIGWKDRFADPAHGKRQREYARIQRNAVVYTPAFIVNGKNWRQGRGSAALPLSQGQPGNLKLILNGGQLSAYFTPSQQLADSLRLNVALLGINLKSRIDAGENEGREAQHDFVVLKHASYSGKNNHWKLDLAAFRHHPLLEETRHFALAAWLSTQHSPVPIQATGGFIPASFLKVTNRN